MPIRSSTTTAKSLHHQQQLRVVRRGSVRDNRHSGKLIIDLKSSPEWGVAEAECHHHHRGRTAARGKEVVEAGWKAEHTIHPTGICGLHTDIALNPEALGKLGNELVVVLFTFSFCFPLLQFFLCLAINAEMDPWVILS